MRYSQLLFAGFATLFGFACGTPADTPPQTGPANGGSAGTTSDPVPGKLFDGRSVSSERAAPIAGGTLIVTRDDATLVASDPDRDRISFVSLARARSFMVELEPGSQPGRVVETKAGRVAALLSGHGSVISLGPDGRETLFESWVCAEPRGIAYDATLGSIWVACRSGVLTQLDADTGRPLLRVRIDDDLTDVLVRSSGIVVTRARNSELVLVDFAGKIVQRARPTKDLGVAYRSLPLPAGEIVVANQFADESVGTAYATNSFACSPIATRSALTLSRQQLVQPPQPGADPRQVVPEAAFESFGLAEFLGPLDLAIAPGARKIAVLAIGNGMGPFSSRGSLLVLPLDATGSSLAPGITPLFEACMLPRTDKIDGEPVAVALDSRGRAFVQTREPAAIVLDNGTKIGLGDESRADTGLALFYMNPGNHVSCASCHPRGLEDGRVWYTPRSNGEHTPRRTQPLAGLRQNAPYGWSGEFYTFRAYFDEVMMRRLSLREAPTAEQVEALASWLDRLPPSVGVDDVDLDAVERGKALFFGAEGGCSACHASPQYTDGTFHAMADLGDFYTPSLLGVGARAPYFHDGCATTLTAVLGACGTKVHQPSLTRAQLDDLVAFLQTL